MFNPCVPIHTFVLLCAVGDVATQRLWAIHYKPHVAESPSLPRINMGFLEDDDKSGLRLGERAKNGGEIWKSS